ncbi:hypothetical protein AB205_0199900 [Aquarana catesbeiana]|uniref:Uncharacterized protein n=1 Tax=Aquarana catesbeiana TaxID=8400 RepID=A0A2G9SNC2_AQUCT|nr:hypothetical protein AB205_0199900 [Aquarana catesbeiana]
MFCMCSPFFSEVVVSPSIEESDQIKRIKSSTILQSKESPSAFASPVLEQGSSIFREKFIPPELSIWDYFIAKVPVTKVVVQCFVFFQCLVEAFATRVPRTKKPVFICTWPLFWFCEKYCLLYSTL